jgi:hypothetical protein
MAQGRCSIRRIRAMLLGVTATTRLHVARAMAIGGIGICVVGTLLPWLRSGERERSSYQLAGVASRLLDGPTATVARAWLVFPLVASATIGALLVRGGRSSLLAAAVVAAVGAVFALLVARAPLPALAGLWVTVVGAGLALLSLAVAPRRAMCMPDHERY